MIHILILILIIGLSIYAIFKKDYFAIIWIILIGILLCSLILVTSQNVSDNYKMVEKTSKQIVSLKSDSSIEGVFFLGIGSISGNNYYFMYERLNNNQFRLIKCRAKNCIIKESNKHPKLIKYYKSFGFGFFTIPLCPKFSHFKIIVPKNTIIKEFKVK